jgi:MFS family permease
MTKVAVTQKDDMKLFWTCFVALSTTSFGFILRALTLPQWGKEFNLTNTQIGEIAGVGLWPFAISIVLFSLIIDRVGYKSIMVVGFICHFSSAILTYFASGYWMLFTATFLVAIGNGTVEAVVNPVVTTMFPHQKTKWLNILHAAWPGGLVMGGIMALVLGAEASWKMKMILILLPTLAYGIMMLLRTFPVNERVKAGVSYIEMLKEVGVIGALIVTSLIVFEIGAIFSWPVYINLIIIGVLVGYFAIHVRSPGQPVFIILMLLMVPLAITELGTDSWISELMAPEMKRIGLQAGWILVYTSAIMMVLRLFAGPIVHLGSPLTLLSVSSAVACAGLLLLSFSDGVMVLVAATMFALGKTFFWPTMLGVVSERFPKGGALTLNMTSGVGMMAAGIIGAVILGFLQDTSIDKRLARHNPEMHAEYVTLHKESIFGDYRSLDVNKLNSASPEDKEEVTTLQNAAKKEALRVVAIFPIIMIVAYVSLTFYYKSRGGYKPNTLSANQEIANE